MRISILLEREPFGPILAKTLAAFWSERYGAAYRVEWVPGATQLTPGAQTWYCNPRLNAIFTSAAVDEVFRPARAEYGRAVSPLRRPAQALYVRAATSRRFARRLAWSALQVTPAVPDADAVLILGGNNRIRLVNFRSNESHVLAKDGFGTDLIQRELEVRTAYETLAPTITAVDPQRRWFAEQVIVGTPLNRLGSAPVADEALCQASTSLHGLHQETTKQEPVDAYASTIADSIGTLLTTHPWLTGPTRTEIAVDVASLCGIIEWLAGSIPLFETAQSHGDFQPANILAAGDNVWLIDWEYTARRHVAYDPLVYHLKARSSQGLARRIEALVLGSTVEPLKTMWPWYPWDAGEPRGLSLAVFLLEELVFRLKETANPLFLRLDASMLDYWTEMRAAVRRLNDAIA